MALRLPIESTDVGPERYWEELHEVLRPAFNLPRLRFQKLAENVVMHVAEIHAMYPIDVPHIVGHRAYEAGMRAERGRTRRLIQAARAYMERVGVPDPELRAAIKEARE